MKQPALFQRAILQRLVQGDLRTDGVTDFQSDALADMRGYGWVAQSEQRWIITAAGRKAIGAPHVD